MRARTRFMLDIALAIGLVAAYRPTWTGVSLHQWLSIAIIGPLLLHLLVNWQWAVRVLSTFFQRLFSTSRVNFVVDSALLVSVVAVMLSGFMVSVSILSFFGVRSSNELVWHAVHLWSANATIALFALHAALHWRWFLGVAKRMVTGPAAQSRGRAVAGAGAGAGAVAGGARGRRVSRAAQAAAERAAAARVLAVLGVTGALAGAVFLGVGVASPLLASASQSSRTASTSVQTCPKTGCTASRCHGDSGESPEVFYGLKPKAKSGARRAATARTAARRSTSRTAPVAHSASAHRVASASAPTRPAPVAPRAKKPRPVAVAAKAPAKKPHVVRMVCPQTGCSATSCHGAHHQSASSFYK